MPKRLNRDPLAGIKRGQEQYRRQIREIADTLAKELAKLDTKEALEMYTPDWIFNRRIELRSAARAKAARLRDEAGEYFGM